MTMPNLCQFWDCTETTGRRNYFLCPNHYPGYQAGTIDKCPGCGSYKDAKFGVCFNCRRRSTAAPPVGSTDGATSRPQSPIQVAEPQADDPRQRYPAQYRTSDGHYVRSRAEWMIDDWLYNHHIAHAYERKLPVAENAISDFYLPQGNVYIEFWGKEDDADYARRMREKREIYRRNGLRLISLTDAELYSLDDHMPRLLRDYGIGIV